MKQPKFLVAVLSLLALFFSSLIVGAFYEVAFVVMVVWVLLFGLAIYLGSSLWCGLDAANRGKPGWAVALLVAVAYWPISWLLWVILRPEIKPPPLPDELW